MGRGRIQRIQDSIHGLMEFEGMETAVIDILRTRELQRLRRIRQMGLGYLVFPGAEHSRFAHSLGTAHLAIRFGRRIIEACRDFLVDELSPDKEAVRDFAVAALCHDLGHGPLSHAWEREIVGEDYNFEQWVAKLGLSSEKEGLRGARWHELVSQGFLAWPDGELYRLLEQHQAGLSKRVRGFLRGAYFPSYLPRLLSSDVDIDRADFLRRDAHHCGVWYGRYDLDWLVATCTVGKTVGGSEELVVGFDQRKAVRVIEQFLIARRAMYDMIYFHKTVRSVEGMVSLFLRRLKEVIEGGAPLAGVQPLKRMMSGQVLDQAELLALDDTSVWTLVQSAVDTVGMDDTVRDLGQRILSRDLFKIVPCPFERMSAFVHRPDWRERLYSAIQRFCPGKAEFYLCEDRTSFSMLSQHESEMTYLISEDRKATRIRDDETLRAYWHPRPEESVRLFTLREAVEAVQKTIGL
jgi:uncharacterized protein